MIDIHSHLLPAIDDGSQSMEQSLAVLRVFAAAGVEGVVLTPHVTATALATDGDGAVRRRDAAYDPLRRIGLTAPKLYLGFEIMLDQPLSAVSMADRRFSLAGSRYCLVEFSLSVVPDFARNVLADIAQAGAVPVVAHPERYQGCSPETVRSWREVGAKMQLDSTTLTKATARGHRARQLLANGLADLIAADNHGNQRILTTGMEYLNGRVAGNSVELLSSVNPRAIIDDQEMVPVPPIVLREGMLDRWRRFVTG